MVNKNEAPSDDGDEEVKRLYTRPAKRLRELRQERYFKEAIRLLNEGLRRFPGNERILCSRGAVFKCLGNRAKARECFAAALKVNPRNVVARNSMGQAWFEDKDNAKAIECFEATLKIDPQNEVALHMMAIIPRTDVA